MLKMLDFKCKDCEHKFEELVEPEELPECPECKSKNVVQPKIQAKNTKTVSWGLWAAGN